LEKKGRDETASSGHPETCDTLTFQDASHHQDYKTINEQMTMEQQA